MTATPAYPPIPKAYLDAFTELGGRDLTHPVTFFIFTNCTLIDDYLTRHPYDDFHQYDLYLIPNWSGIEYYMQESERWTERNRTRRLKGTMGLGSDRVLRMANVEFWQSTGFQTMPNLPKNSRWSPFRSMLWKHWDLFLQIDMNRREVGEKDFVKLLDQRPPVGLQCNLIRDLPLLHMPAGYTDANKFFRDALSVVGYKVQSFFRADPKDYRWNFFPNPRQSQRN